jgi:hypothetical protein
MSRSGTGRTRLLRYRSLLPNYADEHGMNGTIYMATHNNTPYTHIPEGEKISLIDRLLRTPGCPIPRDFSLTREQKLELFTLLIESGTIKYTPTRQQPHAEKKSTQGQSRPVEDPQHTPNAQPASYSIIGTDLLQTEMDIALSQKARLQSTYIIGQNGTGKTTLVANLILQDIRQGFGVCLIEPHGDLTKAVLAGMPSNRLTDVIYLGVEDMDFPFGLNLFECPLPRSLRNMAATASFIFHVFAKVWGAGVDTPRLMQNLRAVTRTLIENPGTTFSEIPLLYSSDTVRARMVDNLSNLSIVSYWEDYERKSQRDRDIYLESTTNKVNSFLDEPMIRNIVSQAKTTIDFRAIMDSGKILLVKLSPQFEEASLLIGAILIGKLLMTAFSRTDTPEGNRRQFNLYCDEFQRFATPDFATLISEARKFKIATTLSHQTLGQLDEANMAAALAAGNLIVFRVSGEDGKALAKSFDTTPTKEIIGEEPIRSPVSDVISHLVKRGHNDTRVTKFAQTYLKNLENFVSRPPHVGIIPTTPANMRSDYAWQGIVLFHHGTIATARELLNQSLYRSMAERTTRFLIPPLALYMLAVAQQDRSELVFDPYLNLDWPDHYLLGFQNVRGATAEIFGDPYFVSDEFAHKFISSRLQKNLFGKVTSDSQREMDAAKRLVAMITELRYTMATLANHPILVDTGQYQPRYQNRTYQDMENQIARDLTQQPNFQARVKLLSGEHTIQTKNFPSLLTGTLLQARIAQIQAQTRRTYCKPRQTVETEIRERQERLLYERATIETTTTKARGGRSSPPPPPTHSTHL